MPQFSHLHVHTQYSLLDGLNDIRQLVSKAKSNHMPAVAITDHGNMFGVFEFVAEANKQKIKPIIGCEFYLVEDRNEKKFTKESGDVRYHQLLLAKDEAGYRNLSKLCSLGYTEGMYSKWPRIDKELVEKYHEGLIATTCCLGAEVPRTIMEKGEDEAEKLFQWWLNLFGEDYYIELHRHKLKEQGFVNEVLMRFAKKYNVKMIASNDAHYLDRTDAEPHDILLCINTGEVVSRPKGDGKGFRFGFENDEFYFKTQEEMNALFSDLPEAIDNTGEIVSKISEFKLTRDLLLPHFPLPAGFKTTDEFLEHLTWAGAKERYGILTPEISSRIEFELTTIKKMGFAGYFLVVQDFIAAARNMDVIVGPGRGSAAGSVVAYCTGIINIDPVKYDLLFERFLNPERVSWPDIDTDFDDKGRERVIDYVVKKYGKEQVAQIVTYGTMAAKMAIKDVARVLEVSFEEANLLTKLVPSRIEGKEKWNLGDAYAIVPELREMAKKDDAKGRALQMARRLEGSVRNTGVHAAGIIIAPDNIMNFIPVSTAKDSELWVTQFEGNILENAGMLKMDFLGLKTLSIVRDAVDLIKKNHGIEIKPDNIPLDDELTLELFRKGNTVAVFQFEAEFATRCLRELEPESIEDLIAMNALNRPGPMQFIPQFIARKHGKEAVIYPHPLLEKILKPTYGIMVYQEQIMQTAQIIAGYSLGGADLLRRAMGKKDSEKMAKEREKFVKGAAEKNQIDEKKANEIFNMMEMFAKYGFNRSHSAAYTVLAFQTAYLKAHYPAEYMSAVLTSNLSKIEDVTFFMDECRKINIPVLGPDVNESDYNFTPNKKGEIRFGLGGVKGIGEAAVEAIISEREKGGSYHSIFEFARRIPARALNKRVMEALAMSGGFDSFGKHRAQYFHSISNEQNTLEKALRLAGEFQNKKVIGSGSLFGEAQDDGTVSEPKIPPCDEWTLFEQSKKEKEVTGIYITGNPLDEFELEIRSFCNTELNDVLEMTGKEFAVAGIVTISQMKTSKNGKPYLGFTIEDKGGSRPFTLWGEDSMKFKHCLEPGMMVFIRFNYKKDEYSDKIWQRILEVKLLSEVREKKTKEIVIRVPLKMLDDDLVDRITVTCAEHKGRYPVQIIVQDDDEAMSVEMHTKQGVELAASLFRKLSLLSAVEVGLN